MKRNLLLLLIVLFHISAYSQQVEIFQQKGKYGIKEGNDRVLVRPSYDRIKKLYDNNFFLVEKNSKTGVITKSGKLIIPTEYDYIEDFGDSFFLVMKDSRWGVLDRMNKVLLSCEYTAISPLNDYLYVIKDSSNKKGLFDKFGHVVLPVKYDDISNFSDNLLLIKDKNLVGLIDNAGTVRVPANFSSIENIESQHLYKITSGDKMGVADYSGNIVAEPVYDDIDSSKPYYTILKKDNKIGFVVNRKLIAPTFDRIVFAQEDLGVIVVRQGELNGFVTLQGMVVNPVYNNISRFSDGGNAIAEKNGKLLFIDITGKESGI